MWTVGPDVTRRCLAGRENVQPKLTLRGFETPQQGTNKDRGSGHSDNGSGADSGAVADGLPPDVIRLATRLATLSPEQRATLASLFMPMPAEQPRPQGHPTPDTRH